MLSVKFYDTFFYLLILKNDVLLLKFEKEDEKNNPNFSLSTRRSEMEVTSLLDRSELRQWAFAT